MQNWRWNAHRMHQLYLNDAYCENLNVVRLWAITVEQKWRVWRCSQLIILLWWQRINGPTRRRHHGFGGHTLAPSHPSSSNSQGREPRQAWNWLLQPPSLPPLCGSAPLNQLKLFSHGTTSAPTTWLSSEHKKMTTKSSIFSDRRKESQMDRQAWNLN